MSEINLLPNATLSIDAFPQMPESLSAALTTPLAADGDGSTLKSYSQVFKQSLDVVNHKQVQATEQMAAVSLKQSDDLIGTVMAIQDASLSFQFLLQARNRLVEGYHELFNQQV